MSIAQNLKKIRKEKGVTQKQVATSCGMAEANYRKYELGKANPKLETLRKISQALDITLSDLIDDWGMFSSEDYAKDFENGNDKLILEHYHQLNEKGQEKAIEQVEMLTKIEEYTKKEPKED